MENAETACRFASKVRKAQTSQEIVTLQTRFAQDQMQAFVKQGQDFCRLIGELSRSSNAADLIKKAAPEHHQTSTHAPWAPKWLKDEIENRL